MDIRQGPGIPALFTNAVCERDSLSARFQSMMMCTMTDLRAQHESTVRVPERLRLVLSNSTATMLRSF